MKSILAILMALFLIGCAVDTFEPRITDEEVQPAQDTIYSGCPVDLKHKKFPWRCISCDSLNIFWQATLIDTLK